MIQSKPKRKLTEEHKHKISLAVKGRVPWNKGKKYTINTNKKLSEEHKEKLFASRRGKPPWNKGIMGKDSHNWKGGRSTLTHRIRTSEKYKQWRSDVYKRDSWDCQTCGKHGGGLEAHHIISVKTIISIIPDELDINEKFFMALQLPKLFDVDNGVTLCKSCHIRTFEGAKYDSV